VDENERRVCDVARIGGGEETPRAPLPGQRPASIIALRAHLTSLYFMLLLFFSPIILSTYCV
jgi:hypothetical protein